MYRVMMVEYVNEIVVAYDMALSELSDGFSIAKRRRRIQQGLAHLLVLMIYLL